MNQLKSIKDRCIENKKELLPVLLCFVIATIVLFSFVKVDSEEPKEEIAEPSVTIQEEEETPTEPIQKEEATLPETVTEIKRENWYVTTDEYTDRVGNLKTIFNFCAYDWLNAKQWLIDHYNTGWPYGTVKESHTAKNWGRPVAMAIAISTIRESSAVPDMFQKMNNPGALSGPFGPSYSNQYVFDCLANRLHAQGYGLISWTFGCVDDFVDFCRSSGLNPRSMETQLYFMAYQYYANAEWYKRYTYLFPYESVEPTLENIKEVSRIHTTCVCMGNVPSKQYPKVMRATYRIIDDWGSATYSDLVASASGAYELLYREAYHGDPLANAETDRAESSMYEGSTGEYGVVPNIVEEPDPIAEDPEQTPTDEEDEAAKQEEIEGKTDPDAVTGASLEPDSVPADDTATDVITDTTTDAAIDTVEPETTEESPEETAE